MDVPLALNDIEIRLGLKGYKRKSSTFSLQTDVVGLSAFFLLYYGYSIIMDDIKSIKY